MGDDKRMNKIVWKTKVNSRNFISDFGADLKNIIGGKLRAYEVMIDKAIEEASSELTKEYPNVQDIKFQITEFSNKSVAVIVYGRVEC